MKGLLVLLAAYGYYYWSQKNKKENKNNVNQPYIVPADTPANRAEMATDLIQWKHDVAYGQIRNPYGMLAGGQFA